MTTTRARDLVDAVRPCLPLPGIESFGLTRYSACCVGRGLDDEHDNQTFDTIRYDDNAEQMIIGAIWQACAERGWSIHTMHLGKRLVAICGSRHPNLSEHRQLASADGTDAIALCRAYAAACEAGKGATDA